MGTYKHFSKGNKIFPYNIIQWNLVLLREDRICVRHKSRDQISQNRQESETIFDQWPMTAQLETAQGSGGPSPVAQSDPAQGSHCVWVTFATVKLSDSKTAAPKANLQTKMINKEGKCVLEMYNVIIFLYQMRSSHWE